MTLEMSTGKVKKINNMERYDYPAVAGDKDTAPIITKIKELKDGLHLQELLLGNEIVRIQQNCSHNEFSEERGKLPWSLHPTILFAKTCKACGRTETKDWHNVKFSVVCEQCWGEMKYSHTSNDGDRMDFYECISCHHVYSQS